MIEVTAKKTFSHGNTVVKRGSSFEVTDQISKDYLRAGLVEELKAKKAPAATPPAAVPPAAAPPAPARSSRSDRSGD